MNEPSIVHKIALGMIPGVGDITARKLVSYAGSIEALFSESFRALTKIPGIGKTKAEKLIFELKRKLPQLEALSGHTGETSSDRHDAVEALAALGFDEAKAAACVNEILKSSKDAGLEEIIKEALKLLS